MLRSGRTRTLEALNSGAGDLDDLGKVTLVRGLIREGVVLVHES